MALEQVIEQDIIKFLDSELPQQAKQEPVRQEEAVVRDWLQEIKNQLKRNKVEEAKKIFEELKKKYGAVPEAHHEERKHFYDLVQTAYIEIFNYINDKTRTTMLLQHFERSPDAVFDQNVRPVNLQTMQSGQQVKLPDFEPLTKRTLQQISSSVPTQQTGEHTPIQGFELSLPTPPPVTANTVPLQAIQGAASAPVRQPTVIQSPMQATVQVDDVSQENLRLLIKRALTVAVTSPERAHLLLEDIKEKISSLQPQQARIVQEKIDVLEAAIMQHRARMQFTKMFNEEYVRVASMARLKNELSLPAFTRVYEKAAQFEQHYPAYQGVFTKKLELLREQYFLYSEDQLAELVQPHVLKIKRAEKGSVEQQLAIEDLQHFIKTLPPSKQRDQLRKLVQNALQPQQQQQPAQPQKIEDPLPRKVQHFVHRLNAAKTRKDTAGFLKALDEFSRFTQRLPAGDDKQLLQRKIDALRGQLTVGEKTLSMMLKPYLRRIAKAKLSHNDIELELALESLRTFVHSLPEEEQHLVARLGGT